MAMALLSVSTVVAGAPDGFYSSLEGKCGTDLKAAAKKVCASLTTVSYGDNTWNAFRSTDVREVDGRLAWFDMYSNILVYEATGYEGMNIEHSVPNSWWGGNKNNAYKDLYHLNPSNSDANNRKSNHPLGIVGNVSWTNGVSTIGAPAAGTGGGSATVYEPADQFKGDFARAYFYVFTIYDDISWVDAAKSDYMYDRLAYPSLKPWATEMLLQWAEEDPVDSREMARNDAVAAIQGNRNPYIDIPALASYVWGENASTPLNLQGLVNPMPVNRPEAPVFDTYSLTGLDTYAGRWWDDITVTLSAAPSATIQYSIDGGDYIDYPASGISIGKASSSSERITIRAKAMADISGSLYASPVSTLVLDARNPDELDFSMRSWSPVVSEDQLTEDGSYILVAEKAKRVMLSVLGSSSSGKYMTASESALEFDGEKVKSVPTDAGIVSLLPGGEGKWILSIADTKGKPLGCYTTSEAKKMSISEAGTPAAISFEPGGVAVIDFGNPGLLKYNASSPRFLNYTASNQQGVLIYIADDEQKDPDPGVGIDDIILSDIVRVSGSDIIAPQGSKVYDLGGRPVGFTSLSDGIYIVVTPNAVVKVVISK